MIGNRKTLAAVIAFLVLGSAPTFAQGEVDVMEIARQIRRNMIQVEESLHSLDGEDARKAARQAAKDMDKLVDPKGKDGSSSSDGSKSDDASSDEIRRRGEQVVKDIDRIVKSLKPNGQGGGGGSKKGKQKKQGKQPRQRDRNKSEKQKGDKPQKQKKPKGGREKNDQQDPKDGRNTPSNEKQYPNPEKAKHIQLEEKWGFLPAERRQQLVDRNFKDFTPEYEREIKAYFKKIVKKSAK